jgi:hypothetical protein
LHRSTGLHLIRCPVVKEAFIHTCTSLPMLKVTTGSKKTALMIWQLNLLSRKQNELFMMLQGICLKVEFVEFVIQILKKATKLTSEAEAHRREAWAGLLFMC